MIQLAVIVPCFNEEDVLPETNVRLMTLMTRMQQAGLIGGVSAVYYVDDGSTDRTWEIIESLAAQDNRAHGVKLSRNCGHQAALLAGLMTVEGDVLVSIDADLQDDVNAIEKMVIEFKNGADIVYGVRDSRITDSFFKRRTALGYYKIMRQMGVDLIHNHADFRLMSRRAIEALRKYDEVNVFLRGVVPLIGYKTTTVKYDRAGRFAGESKYPLRKMLAFAVEGVTSFSVVPLRLITWLGFIVSIMSFSMIVFVLYGTLVLGAVVPGWASSVIPIYFLGGIQILAIGILGEYISKIYLESKRRPKYFIEKML